MERSSYIVIMNNYHLYEEIGRGKFSVVYKSRYKRTLQYYAIKSIEKSRKKITANEARILENIAHENIVRFHQWYETRNHLWTIMEYCAGGDLYSLLQQDKKLPESTVVDFGIQIRDALFFLHSIGVIFANLKPKSVLFNEYSVLKLNGFENARLHSDDPKSFKLQSGMPYYLAPELFEDSGVYSYASDLWAFGCLLFELGEGQPPFVADTFEDSITKILTQETPPAESLSPEMNNLISKLLVKDSSKRITWEEIMCHEAWGNYKRVVEGNLPLQQSYQEYLAKRGECTSESSLKSRSIEMFRFSQNQETKTYNARESKDMINYTFKEQEKENISEELAKSYGVDQLLLHSSDMDVKPIFGSRQTETSSYQVVELPGLEKWDPYKAAEEVHSKVLEYHLSQVYSMLQSQPPHNQMVSILVYLEELLVGFEMADKLVNSAFVALLLKLTQLNSSEVNNLVCRIFGQMLRHAGYIELDLTKLGLWEKLLEMMQDSVSEAVAALGEYLFYTAIRMDEEELDGNWEIQTHHVELFESLLEYSEPTTLCYFACRTIENVLSQSKIASKKFAKYSIGLKIAKVFKQSSEEDLKVSSAVALCHFIRNKPQLFNEIVNGDFEHLFLRSFEEGALKVQQAFLTILCIALKHNLCMISCEVVTSILLPMLESQVIPIRAKAALGFHFLIQQTPEILSSLHFTSFYSVLHKLSKDKHLYVKHCFSHLLETISDSCVLLLKEGNPKNLSCISQICNSPVRFKLAYPAFIKNLAMLVAMDLGKDNHLVLQVCEALSRNKKPLIANSELMVTLMLPALLQVLTRDSDTRFRALQVFSDFFLPLLFEDEVFDPKDLEKFSSQLLDELIRELVPRYHELLVDEEPIVLSSLKLLSAIVDRHEGYLELIREEGLVPEFAKHFQKQSYRNSITLIKHIKKLTV